MGNMSEPFKKKYRGFEYFITRKVKCSACDGNGQHCHRCDNSGRVSEEISLRSALKDLIENDNINGIHIRDSWRDY